jgi:ribosome biogenesis SPOUT family RNA methylase Rps3
MGLLLAARASAVQEFFNRENVQDQDCCSLDYRTNLSDSGGDVGLLMAQCWP